MIEVPIGFTGTRRGTTKPQENTLARLFFRYEGNLVLHHGDCYGADAEAHVQALKYAARIVIHPPTDSKYQAWCIRFENARKIPVELRDPFPYLERNHHIVDETEFLIGTPRESHNVLRSGTWATIRYARKVGKRVVLIRPDGSVWDSTGRL